jgi:hypothetical protein
MVRRDPSYVHRVLMGEVSPSSGALSDLARVLRVTMDALHRTLESQRADAQN